MRKIKLDEWIEGSSEIPSKKKTKRKLTPRWKLLDSIKFIKMKDKYLKEKGVLVKKGKRKYRLNVGF